VNVRIAIYSRSVLSELVYEESLDISELKAQTLDTGPAVCVEGVDTMF
jgi:hypothetical protein